MPGDLVETPVRLSAAQAAEVGAAADRTAASDDQPPLNEAARLHLQHPRSTVTDVLVRSQGEFAGYAQLDSSSTPPVGQLFVAPDHRRSGLGTRLVEALIERAPDVQIWAKGDSEAARALAARTGLRVGRQLLIMERSLTAPLPQSRPMPPGVELRTFRPGADEAAWLTVNAAAFAHHREQGSLTRADLDERMAEDWFDPEGFFLATRGDEVLGFHWTKQHAADLGEVYVLGVGPDAAGQGLGRALLLVGLEHLRTVGDRRVILYVEGDNEPALALYRGYGFTQASRDVMYAPG